MENLSKFYGDPDWVLVENILRECVKSVRYKPDSSTTPTDFKAQTLANERLYDAVTQFLSQAKVITQAEPQDNIFS